MIKTPFALRKITDKKLVPADIREDLVGRCNRLIWTSPKKTLSPCRWPHRRDGAGEGVEAAAGNAEMVEMTEDDIVPRCSRWKTPDRKIRVMVATMSRRISLAPGLCHDAPI